MSMFKNKPTDKSPTDQYFYVIYFGSKLPLNKY